MFEALYLKRPSKSSHSSKSSNDSIRGDDSISTFARSNHISTSKNKDYSSPNKKSSIIRAEKREYLFGSTFDREPKDEPEKENIYEDYQQSETSCNHKNNDNDNNNYRFKTITINNLRRSFRDFRDTFLHSAKPAKGREHQQLWFIDVKDKRDEANDNVEKPNRNNSNWQPIDDDDDDKYVKEKRRVKRNETFRIDTNSKDPINNTLSRRETFRINREQSPIRSSERSRSVESNSSSTAINYREPYKLQVNRKIVPIAITAPYSASNDTEYYSNSSFNREFKNNAYHDDDNDSNHEENPQSYSYTTKQVPNNRIHSPTRYGGTKPSNAHARPAGQTRFGIGLPEKNGFLHNDSNNGRSSFEHRSKPERQSLNDFNSLRSKFDGKLEQPDNYDIVDTREDKSDSTFVPSQSKLREPWRRISSRRLSKDTDSENRSFVPYRSGYNTYSDPTLKMNNSNRTTININCDYDSNSKRSVEQSNNSQRYKPPHIHTFSIPFRTVNKVPPERKTKSNRNRSVNFPSVECEVRLISPNYETTPRRKVKPANWTFNKVHL